jgi:hypothetical protein
VSALRVGVPTFFDLPADVREEILDWADLMGILYEHPQIQRKHLKAISVVDEGQVRFEYRCTTLDDRSIVVGNTVLQESVTLPITEVPPYIELWETV